MTPERPALDARLLVQLAALPREQVPSLLIVLAARLAEPEPSPTGRDQTDEATPPKPEPASRWLTPAEAAEMANVPRRTVYGWSRRRDWHPFTHRLSRKVLRIEDAGFRRWLARQKQV